MQIHIYIHTLICAKKINTLKAILAFTLAEILVTLGIIGIISAVTIPTLINSIEDMQYKSAYKKAYSNLYQAFNQVKTENSLVETSTPQTIANTGGNDINVQTIMGNFKLVKKCDNNNNPLCWDNTGEQYGKNYASEGRPLQDLSSFIDSSGMAWTTIEWSQGRIAVDTNGFKKPNQYGKDRFVFYLYSGSQPFTVASQTSGIPTTIRPYTDNYVEVCTDNACGSVGNKDYQKYFGTSWLYN